MPNDMYKEYQSLSGNKDPMAMQRRRELARGLQAQRRGQVPPGTVAAPALEQSRERLGSPWAAQVPPSMPQRPVNPGNRMPTQVVPWAQNETGGYGPDMQARINQILSQFNRRA
jgi:hypothetical protein